MIKKVNKLGEVHLKILSLYTKGYNKNYYIREIQKMLQISTRTALLTLADLEKRTILTSTRRGKIKTYQIKPDIITREYFVLAETYKKINFLQQHLTIKTIIENIEAYIQGIALIFGSYAKGIEKKDSDLDFFLVGTGNTEKIKEIAKTYGIVINIQLYPQKIFEKNIKEDILIKEVIENHIIIKGTGQFINKVISWIK
ncbi:MAG: nucleotidyltransferase domain-containing protein [bacterium]|nr:nucleotidyltransferase domain-containing protein [bacterium]